MYLILFMHFSSKVDWFKGIKHLICKHSLFFEYTLYKKNVKIISSNLTFSLIDKRNMGSSSVQFVVM